MKIKRAILEKIIWEETQLLVEEVSADLPDLFAHMALAIYEKAGAGGPEDLIYAIDSALSFLIEKGFITGDSDLSGIGLTSLGASQNAPHASESPDKTDYFYTLLNAYGIDENS